MCRRESCLLHLRQRGRALADEILAAVPMRKEVLVARTKKSIEPVPVDALYLECALLISGAKCPRRNSERLPSRIESLLDNFGAMYDRVSAILARLENSEEWIAFAEEVLFVELEAAELQYHLVLARAHFLSSDC